jgi:alpha-tubulin suppressor-like RCC1 family protein
MDDQSVKCAGTNAYGQLGTALETDERGDQATGTSTFTSLSGLAAASKISVGVNHSCVMLQADTSILCWGRGNEGALGSSSLETSYVPTIATELNTAGSANVQLVASWSNTYVDIS